MLNIKFPKVWTFIDPTGIRRPMSGTKRTELMWPETAQDWTWEQLEGVYTDYNDVIICCVGIDISTYFHLWAKKNLYIRTFFSCVFPCACYVYPQYVPRLQNCRKFSKFHV